MKRILVDMNRLGKNKFNGLYVYCYHLASCLKNNQPENTELYYYLPKKLFGLFGDKVKYIAHKSIDKFFHRKAMGFDIWHSTTTLSWYMPADKKTKFIFTLHDINFLIETPERKKSNQRYLKLIQKRINRADHIIAISSFSLGQAKQYLDLGNKPTSVISPGCSFITEKPEEKEPAYIPKRPFLFSIGLIQKRKNFHVIMPLLQNNDYEYIISGIDAFEYKETIILEAEKYGVLDRVIFTGPVSEGEKAWYYKNCIAFMFPSIAEGFGLPVVEAMYYGKPVFLSRETSLPEIGGEPAYYFNSFDAAHVKQKFSESMIHYATHQPQEKIKQQAMQFTFNKMTEKILNVYKSF
jgi:glycosyltransferase involved in cell wall biosynthesis